MANCFSQLGVSEYPAPNTSNQTILDLITYSNYVTCNIFGYMLLITIFAISYISFREREGVMTASLFVTTLFSVLFAAVSIVTPDTILYGLILLAVSFYFKW